MKHVLLSLFALCLTVIAGFAQSGNGPVQLTLQGPSQRFALDFSDDLLEVQLCGLQIGETYFIQAVEGLSARCGPEVRLADLPEQVSPFSRRIELRALESCASLLISTQCPAGSLADGYLSITNLNGKGKPENNQPTGAPRNVISGAPNPDAFGLIQQVLIGGQCFDVANVDVQGAEIQYGNFGGGDNSIGIGSGVILSTGDVSAISGPNTSASTSTAAGGGGGDPDLAQIAAGGLNDVCVIEFDFTPTVAGLAFDYVFASEEYCEYAGSSFNDVFGFFLSGPGINGPYTNGAINIATLPGGAGPVAINNVNHFSNQGFFISNDPFSAQCSGFAPAAQDAIEFDGYTTVLTAVAQGLIPCETYHIKLAIADVGDAIYDSAVFLKANSFFAGDTYDGMVTATGPALSATQPYEGCSDAALILTRYGDTDQDLVVNLTVLPGSTATPGQDYEPFPTTVTIPAGQSSITVLIDIFADLIVEGSEFIYIELESPCSCFRNGVQIEIVEPPPVDVLVPDTIGCINTPVQITPNASGGVPGYTFTWSNGTSGPTTAVTPTEDPVVYTVTATDACGQETVTDFTVDGDGPEATINGIDSVCQGDNLAVLNVEFDGEGGPYNFTYDAGNGPVTVSNITENPYQVVISPANPGFVNLISIEENGCFGTVGGIGEIASKDIVAAADVTPISCPGQTDGAIAVQPSGGTGPYTFNWNNGLADQPDQSGLPPGTYQVDIFDAEGCFTTVDVVLDDPPAINLQVANIEDIDCNNPDLGSIDISVSGGTPPFTYLWNTGATSEDLDSLPPGSYSVAVTDASGCTEQQDFTFTPPSFIPLAQASPLDLLTCSTTEVTLDGSSSSTGPEVAYQWLDPQGNVIPGANAISLAVNTPGTYALIVSDTSGNCVDTTQVEVLEDLAPPTASAAVADTLTCQLTSLSLQGSGSAGGGPVSYAWSSADGNILSGAGTDAPVVDAAGSYILEVTNDQNGCTTLDTVNVVEDISPPNVSTADPDILTCAVQDVVLSGTGSAPDSIAYTWSTTDGLLLGDANADSTLAGAPGTYTLEVTNLGNGCSATASVNVQEDIAPPLAEAGPDPELDCQTANATLDGSASSSGPEFAYQWSPPAGTTLADSTSVSITATAPGWYVLEVTDTENGCIALDSVLVTPNSNAPQVQAAVSEMLTCETLEVELDGSGSDSGAGFDIAWTSVEGNPIQNPNSLQATVNDPGTYTLTIVNTANGCVSVDQVEVVQDIVLPNVNPGPGGLITCYDPLAELDGSNSDFGPNFQAEWTTTDGNITGSTNSLNTTVDEGGTYTLTIVNTLTGCTNQATVTVDQNTLAPTADAGPDGLINCSIDEVSLQGNNSTSGPNVNFVWNELAGSLAGGDSSLMPTVQAAGTFELVVADPANGCESRDTVVVAENFDTPVADAGPPSTITCADPQALLDGSASSSGADILYQWSTPDGNLLQGIDSAVALADAPGTYQLVLTNLASTCSDTATVAISEDVVEPVADAGDDQLLTCNVTSLNLDASGSSTSGPFNYVWTTPDGNLVSGQNTLNPLVDQPGTYTLEVTNSTNGCQATDVVVIANDPNLPIADAGADTLLTCAVTSIVLDGNNSSQGADVSYLWETSDGQIDGGETTLSPTISAPGTYTLSVANAVNGCVKSASVVVGIDTLAPDAFVAAPEDLTCSQTSLSLDGSGSSTGPNFEYLWTSQGMGSILTGANTLEPEIGSGGTYQLEVTNTGNGCVSTASVAVAYDTLAPTGSIASPAELTCIDTLIQLQASADGNAPLTYSWTTSGGNLIQGMDGLSPTVDAPGDYQLLITNTGNGCTLSLLTTVSQDIVPPLAEAGATAELTCDQPTLILDGSQSDPGDYLWTTPDGTILSGSATQAPVIGSPGTYVLEVTNPGNGCTATDEVMITADEDVPMIALAEPALLTCAVQEVTLNLSSDDPGNIYEYEWTGPGGNPIGSGPATAVVVNQAGTYLVQVVNTDNGCTALTSTTVDQDITPPTVEAGDGFVLNCEEVEFQLTGYATASGAPMAYAWTTTDGSILSGANTLTPTITDDGQYVLEVTNLSNGCKAADQVAVIRDVPYAARTQVYPPPCPGDRGSILIGGVEGGIGPYIYSLDGGFTFSDLPLFDQLQPGDYNLLVQDVNGCELETSVSIDPAAPIQITVDSLHFMEYKGDYQLEAVTNIPEQDIASISWFPEFYLSCADCLNPVVSGLDQSITYSLTVRNQEGCEDQVTVRVFLEREIPVFIPNAFSPFDSPGSNDRFTIFSNDQVVNRVVVLRIYDRWGEMLFEQENFPPNDPSFGWDGMLDGQPMNGGVYVYWTELETTEGDRFIRKGDFVLMR